MPQRSEDYGCVSDIELKPVYISLGVAKALKPLSGATPSPPMFQAAIDGGTKFADCVWLFRNESCYRFNVKKGAFEDGPVRMKEWWGDDTFPLSYSSHITGAVWAGEAYPDLVYFYQGNTYARYNFKTKTVDVAPVPIVRDWASARGNWFGESGPQVAIHAIGAKNAGFLHIFSKGQYLKHNLNNGLLAAGPMAISQAWALPEPFTEGFDFAFYGTDEESQKIYFVKGQDYVLYDTATDTSGESGKIHQKYPALTRFSGDPQLFLAETYKLRSYAGPTEGGEVIDSKPVGPGEKKEIEFRYQKITEKNAVITSSMLESGENSTENNFYEQVKDENRSSTSKEAYDYQFEGTFDGEASATSLTGGEAHAKVTAHGATNDVRDEFAKAAFKTVDNQVKSTSKQLRSSQKATAEEEKFKTIEDRVEKSTVENKSDHMITWEYRQQRQKYVALLSLCSVQLTYADGKKPPETAEIDQMDVLLEKHVPEDKERKELKKYIVGELQSIIDEYGQKRSIVKSVEGKEGSIYKIDSRITSDHPITNQDGSQKILTVNGITKSSNVWLVPTGTVVGMEK